MLCLVNSTLQDVSRKEALGYAAVRGAVQRCVRSHIDWSTVTELGVLGLDEIALLKGRQHYRAILST